MEVREGVEVGYKYTPGAKRWDPHGDSENGPVKLSGPCPKVPLCVIMLAENCNL